jgi:hypothetical protein
MWALIVRLEPIARGCSWAATADLLASSDMRGNIYSPPI